MTRRAKSPPKNKKNRFNCKVFILPRVAELLNHKEKQRGSLLLNANKHTYKYKRNTTD